MAGTSQSPNRGLLGVLNELQASLGTICIAFRRHSVTNLQWPRKSESPRSCRPARQSLYRYIEDDGVMVIPDSSLEPASAAGNAVANEWILLVRTAPLHSICSAENRHPGVVAVTKKTPARSTALWNILRDCICISTTIPDAW